MERHVRDPDDDVSWLRSRSHLNDGVTRSGDALGRGSAHHLAATAASTAPHANLSVVESRRQTLVTDQASGADRELFGLSFTDVGKPVQLRMLSARGISMPGRRPEQRLEVDTTRARSQRRRPNRGRLDVELHDRIVAAFR